MEHRWGKRVVVDVPIRLVAGPFSGHAARLANLSVSGGCIKSSFQPRLLSRIEFAIELPPRFTQSTPLLVAYVTRKFNGGVGIEWCEFAPAAIGELIRSATPRLYGYPRRSEPPPGAQASHALQPLSPAPQALLPRVLLKHGT